MQTKQQVVVLDLGLFDYREAWALQQSIQQRLIADVRGQSEVERPHVLMLVEHPHVYTLGKNGDAGNLLLQPDRLAAINAEYVPIDRGGDITYHGPGQLVAYPIFNLNHFFTDIHRYLRFLEDAVIQTLADYHINGGRVAGKTGVWVGPDDRGAERKVCAMGIRCSRWVTMHGLALNVDPDLSYFGHIIPCGIVDRGVTSMAKEINRSDLRVQDVAKGLTQQLASLFNFSFEVLSPPQARQWVDTDFLPGTI
jgi:lipoyl(octanoyl) transferase